jgi:hypothetical protein
MQTVCRCASIMVVPVVPVIPVLVDGGWWVLLVVFGYSSREE